VFFLVALVLLVVLPWPWNLVGFVGSLTVFVGEILFWNRKVRGQGKAVGAQTLIGQEALVVSPCRPDGQVRILGEIWAARCGAGAEAGETVTVVGREGLSLLVEPTRPRDGEPTASPL
jgi:membrane protein implicated in regulation of membrane protease activity